MKELRIENGPLEKQILLAETLLKTTYAFASVNDMDTRDVLSAVAYACSTFLQDREVPLTLFIDKMCVAHTFTELQNKRAK